jgi:1,2-diacylglycerol 3-beta-galactosyltransferase
VNVFVFKAKRGAAVATLERTPFNRMKTVDFVFFDAGGGHRAAANALKMEIERRGLPWQIRLMNLQEILDTMDLFRQVFGVRLQDVYNQILRKGWTWGSAQMLVFMHGLIRLYHPLQVRKLRAHWAVAKPDLVVSLVPNFNRAMYQSLQQALPGTLYCTVMTDLADYPPHFWIERQAQTFICGTEKAFQQAQQIAGPAGATIHQASGMILHPRFYESAPLDRAAERQRLGLDPARPTGVILFGGYGSAVIPEIIERLRPLGGRLQLIVICGKNEKLRAKIRAMPAAMPLHVEGFTTEVPYYMRLADFFIGKPGPGSISEALQMGLPVIVERNSFTLPQERYNADWVREKQVGFVLPNFRGIEEAVRKMLEPDTLAQLRANAAALQNRAVFEIPDLLATMLA